MLNKMNLSAALMLGCAFGGALHANEPVKAVETYIGMSGGIGVLKGSRHESSVAPGIVRHIPGKQRLSSTAPAFDLNFGVQYNMASSKLFIAVEPFLSLTKYSSKTGGMTFGETETNSIVSRYALGIDFKPGIKLTERDSLFISLGCEVREFNFRHTNTLGADLTSRHRTIAGSYGAGYERSVGRAVVGLHLKHRMYKKTNFAAPTGGTDTIKSKIRPNAFTAMVTFKYKI